MEAVLEQIVSLNAFSSQTLNVFSFSLTAYNSFFMFLWALLILLVTVTGISSLVNNDFSLLRETDDLLHVMGNPQSF